MKGTKKRKSLCVPSPRVIVLTATEQIYAIQQILFPDDNTEWDGVWGPKSQAALDAVATKRKAEHGKSKSSWYSQYEGRYSWVDKGDGKWNKNKTVYLGPNNALGVPDDKQGIALPSRSTLGQWFIVTAPNGKSLKLQQTDIGPAKRTGRLIDIAAVAAEAFGYSPDNFPTDKGIFYWEPF